MLQDASKGSETSGAEYAAVFMRVRPAAELADGDALNLRHWTESDWKKLLAHTVPRTFRASETLIQRGAEDRVLCFVAAGSVEVGVYREDGASIAPIARIGSGSVIGEQSFFDGEPRSTNVWAVSDGELLRLAPEDFDRFKQAEPALACDLLFALGCVLSVRLRRTTLRNRR